MRFACRTAVSLCFFALLSARGFSQSCTVTATLPSGPAPLPIIADVSCPSLFNDRSFTSATVDFGDGSPISAAQTSTIFTLFHTYTSPGAYTITATASYPGTSSLTGQASVSVSAQGPTPQQGDIYISGTRGLLERRLPDGTLAQVLSLAQDVQNQGIGFDRTGRLFVTASLTSQNATVANDLYFFDNNFNPQPYGSETTPNLGITFDRSGDMVTAGNTGGTNGTSIQLDEYFAGNTFPSSFFPDVDSSGANWADLGIDACTLYYTINANNILTFNVCQQSQGSGFGGSLPGNQANDIRVLPNGKVIVADENELVLLNSDGSVSLEFGQTNPTTGQPYSTSLNALALDPDGTSVWVGDRTGQILKFDITSGQSLLAQPITSSFSVVNGLAIVGEMRAAELPGPSCTLSLTPNTGFATLNVSASGSCTSQFGSISQVDVDWGDDSSSSFEGSSFSVQHSFQSPGTYQVFVSTTDSNSVSASASQFVVVKSPIVCSFNINPSSGPAPLDVNGTASCSDQGGTISSIAINWGDSTTPDTQANSASITKPHTFTNPGQFNASVTATDANGQSGSAFLTVNVTPAGAPSCTLNVSPQSGQVQLQVSVTATCTDPNNDLAFISLGFGDGSNGTNVLSGQTVQHTYERTGNFNVNVFAEYNDQISPTASANQNVFVTPITPARAPARGDIYVSGDTGLVERHAPDGTLLDVLDTEVHTQLGQMAFNAGHDLFVTNFRGGDGSPNIFKFAFSDSSNTPFPFGDESMFSTNAIVTDQDGNVYLGGGGGEGGPFSVEKFDPSGNKLATYTVDPDPDGNGRIGYFDLAADQCTLYYDGFGFQIKRFNVCTNQQLDDFADNIGTETSQAGEFRIRPNGEVILSDFDHALRLGADGSTQQTYGRLIPSYLALSLDPDGRSFWATQKDGSVYHIDIITGTLLSEFDTDFDPNDNIGNGLAIFGEIRAATNPGPSCTLTVTPAMVPVGISVTANGNCSGSEINTLDFGDGTVLQDTSSGTHAYTTQGTITVTLTGTDANGTSNVVTQTVTVGPNSPPSCSLNVAPLSGTAPLAVSATGNCTDPDNDIVSTSLDFGDGTTISNTTSASHTYAAAGTFTVTLSATDSANNTTSATQTVTVGANQPPTCTLSVMPTGGTAPLMITVTGSCTDPENALSSTLLDFGDGTTQASPNGTHTYANGGTFTVTLTGTDAVGQKGTATQTVTVTPNLPPTCTLSVVPTGGAAPLTVTVTGSCTDPENALSSTLLDFGDGTSQASPNGIHTYANAGTFTVTLTGTDAVGQKGTATKVVTVTPNLPPTCTLSVAPISGAAPLSVTVTGSCSDPENALSSTLLDFGDGTTQTSPNGIHTYANAGTFTVTLTGTDAVGQKGTATKVVTVTPNLPPTCTLTVAPTNGLAPLAVTATGSCTDPENALSSTLLDFGDGTTQASSSGTHTYTTAGKFTVTLTGTDAVGQKGSATQTVTVILNTAPTCTLTVAPLSGTVPLNVTASGNCIDAENNISTTVLDFGDGTTQAAPSGTHTYNSAGTFTVKLTATDSLGLVGSASQTVTASVNNFPPGVFVGISGGIIKQLAGDGTVLKTINTGVAGTVSGMNFDKAGNLYVTDFTAGNVTEINLTSGTVIGSFGSGYNCQPESIVFDGAGNAYVGQQGCNRTVLKFDPSGKPLATYTVATEDQGSDDIALSADECTLLYTSEGPSVLRYDVCKNQQLTPFAAGLKKALNLRILPDGGVIVADLLDIVRLSSTGQVLTTYTAANQTCLYSITLDQDGTSFWAGDYCSSNIYKFDINSGRQLTTFNTGTATGTVFGLAISGTGLNVAGLGSGGTLTASPSAATLSAGQSATFTVAFTPNAAAAGKTITLSCAGLPVGLTCSFNPPTITLGAAETTTTAQMTISRTTTAELRQGASPWMLATWMGGLPAMVLMGIGTRRRRRGSLLWLGVIVACTGIWASCGGGTSMSNSSTSTPTTTPQGSFTVLVVGTASGVQASAPVNLTIQ